MKQRAFAAAAAAGRVIRTICIMDHAVKGLESPESAQIILPQSQVGRKNGEPRPGATNLPVPVASASLRATRRQKHTLLFSWIARCPDIYISVLGNAHQVTAKGKHVAIVSTTCETAKPEEEVAAGMALLGAVITRFDNIVDCKCCLPE